MEVVLGSSGQGRHNGIGLLQQSAVLAVSGFVSDQFLEVNEENISG